MAVGIKVDGLDDLNRQLKKLAKESPAAVRRASFAGGLVIQRASQENTPDEYGNLRGSAYTQKTALGAEVGHAVEYALYVHENMEQVLKGEPRPSGLGTYWNPGGPKFLERAVNENAEEVRGIVEAYLQEVLGQ